MKPALDHTLTLECVGRRGLFRCEFARAGRRTVLTDSFCSTPWHQIPPSYLDDSGCAVQWLVNPSGGLVGGDYVEVEARLHADAHVIMTSPSATRVYRSLADPAVQVIRLSVGPGARLEWVPELTIPFAGSRLRQTIRVDLAEGATVMLWDGLAAGRIARDERWAFAELYNEIRITTPSGAALVERFTVEPSESMRRGSLAMAWDYVASLFVIGEGVSAETWINLEESLARIADQWPGLVLAGVSKPAVPGLAVKLLARSAPDLTLTLKALWVAVRKELWNLPVPNLRRY